MYTHEKGNVDAVEGILEFWAKGFRCLNIYSTTVEHFMKIQNLMNLWYQNSHFKFLWKYLIWDQNWAMSSVFDKDYSTNKQWTVVNAVFYSKSYVKINEVKDFEFNIWKIFNKISNRFHKYSDEFSHVNKKKCVSDITMSVIIVSNTVSYNVHSWHFNSVCSTSSNDCWFTFTVWQFICFRSVWSYLTYEISSIKIIAF